MTRRASLTWGVMAVVALVAAGILLLHWPWLELAFAAEAAPIAWLQSTVLAASALACVAHGVTRAEGTLGWSLSALGFFGLALDERFMGHERLKEWIWLEIFGGDVGRPWIWGDAPMLLNVAIALAAALWIVRQTRSRQTAVLIALAAALGAAAVVMDVATTAIFVQIWEELIELAAESCLLAATLVSLPAPAGR